MNYTGLNEIIQKIVDNNNILIPIHDKPDGDALGAATAFALFLKKLGKSCAVNSYTDIPKRLEFIMHPDVTYITGCANDVFNYDYVITIDIASPKLIPAIINSLTRKIDVVIDHHNHNTLDAEYKYVDPNAAATGEIIFSIISMYCSVTCTDMFDTSICESLFASVSSDTGSFKYGNTTAESFQIASQLKSFGIDTERINRFLFDIKPFQQLKAENLGVEKTKFYYDGKLAVSCIDLADLEKIGATVDDTDNISQITRTISGVQIGVLMREKIFVDGKTGYKFSVRANCDVDVSQLCNAFGGGGHTKAAGCTIYENSETALEMFVKEAEKYII